MEKKDEYEGFDKLMETYNFDSPIKVTLVIEEEDPPEPDLLKALLVSNNTTVPNTNVCFKSSEDYKRTDSNINNAKKKMPSAKKNCNSKSVVEENSLSISGIKTVFPEGHQEKTQDIQWQSLDTVADNLIHITKYHYYNFVNINKQKKNNERLKFDYVNLKHHFFNLSYNTTVALLLPRENDKLFFNSFVHRIITKANRISWFQISHEILHTLICDMLVWTKQKKINLDKKIDPHNYERCGIHWSSSAIKIINRLNHSKQDLNRPFDNGTSDLNYLTQGTNNQPGIVPETYLPEQVTNISPHIRQITNYSTQELTRQKNIISRTNYPMQDTDKLHNNGLIRNNAAPKITKEWHNNCSYTFNSRPKLNILPSLVHRTNHSNQETSSPFINDRTINDSTQEISRLPFVDSWINLSTETITSISNNEPKTNNFSSFQAININTNVCHVNETYGTKSMKRRKTNDNSCCPNSNSSSVPQHKDNDSQYKKDNGSATTFMTRLDSLCHDDPRKAEYELFNIDTMRSSISRDSGFGSPIYGSSRSEPKIETPTNEEQETPIISHVASMNPNDDHLNIGSCKMCGATTDNMCIGCYKEYYCSFLCQTKGWENHKYLCSG